MGRKTIASAPSSVPKRDTNTTNSRGTAKTARRVAPAQKPLPPVEYRLPAPSGPFEIQLFILQLRGVFF